MNGEVRTPMGFTTPFLILFEFKENLIQYRIANSRCTFYGITIIFQNPYRLPLLADLIKLIIIRHRERSKYSYAIFFDIWY